MIWGWKKLMVFQWQQPIFPLSLIINQDTLSHLEITDSTPKITIFVTTPKVWIFAPKLKSKIRKAISKLIFFIKKNESQLFLSPDEKWKEVERNVESRLFCNQKLKSGKGKKKARKKVGNHYGYCLIAY